MVIESARRRRLALQKPHVMEVGPHLAVEVIRASTAKKVACPDRDPPNLWTETCTRVSTRPARVDRAAGDVSCRVACTFVLPPRRARTDFCSKPGGDLGNGRPPVSAYHNPPLN